MKWDIYWTPTKKEGKLRCFDRDESKQHLRRIHPSGQTAGTVSAVGSDGSWSIDMFDHSDMALIQAFEPEQIRYDLVVCLYQFFMLIYGRQKIAFPTQTSVWTILDHSY